MICSQKKHNILVGIVCIDRDIDLANMLYYGIKKNNVKDNIIIVTRVSDVKTINFWHDKAIIITIPHYDIIKRHNYDKIAYKRQIIVDYAKNKKYDAIWFIDSDVIPTPNVLQELAKTEKDICIAPYKIKWNDMPCVGIYSDIEPYIKIHIIDEEEIKSNIKRKPCIIGGFGCTLIKNTSYNVKIEYKMIENSERQVYGEDIGFFLNCYNEGLECEYLPNMIQPHYYDRPTT